MLIREVADQSKYYHDVLAAQLPAGLSDDNDIVGKAFVIAGMKLGMVKAARLFRETPIEQDIVTAYRQLHNELKETAVEDDLGTAQEIGVQLQSAMEDLYYAHRMSNPNPTVKQNIDMLQKSIRSFNQELNGLGYKYAPTVPGLVARMGTRFVEADNKVAPVSAPLRIQPTRTQPNQNVYVAPEKKTTPAAIIHIGKKDAKESDVEEGIRVPAQQILGTKNRAKSAYYPTNVKPKVPKLDRPLTDQELARLAQLAGIKSK
jgi:hypothetical protein